MPSRRAPPPRLYAWPAPLGPRRTPPMRGTTGDGTTPPSGKVEQVTRERIPLGGGPDSREQLLGDDRAQVLEWGEQVVESLQLGIGLRVPEAADEQFVSSTYLRSRDGFTSGTASWPPSSCGSSEPRA